MMLRLLLLFIGFCCYYLQIFVVTIYRFLLLLFIGFCCYYLYVLLLLFIGLYCYYLQVSAFTIHRFLWLLFLGFYCYYLQISIITIYRFLLLLFIGDLYTITDYFVNEYQSNSHHRLQCAIILNEMLSYHLPHSTTGQLWFSVLSTVTELTLR